MQGTILSSRYRVIEYIAKGGFGKTYLAEDIQLPGKNKCVVKQLYPSIDDANFIQVARRMFKKEAYTLNTVGNHDQIPQLLAYFEEEEKFYLVQQYIEGQTLSKELVVGKIWSEAQVVALLRDCLGILDFIHAQGVIHRDVKPDNLIRRKLDNKLVLVDFGTVKEVIKQQTQLMPLTVAVGTRGYMPTEQARGKPRITSDIYALGIIAIQALTGIHPTRLKENDDGEMIWQDLAQCSDQLKMIVFKMTQYHFKERYSSAQETIAALASLNNRSPSSFSPTEVIQHQSTATVQLDDRQLTNSSTTPQNTSSNPLASSSDRSILDTPDNSTSSQLEPINLPPENPPQPRSINELNRANSPEKPSHSPSSLKSNARKSKTWSTLGIALVVGAISSGGLYLLGRQTTQTTYNSLEEQVAHFNKLLDEQNYQDCYDQAVAINAQDQDTAVSQNMSQEQQQEFEAQCGLGLAQAEAADFRYGAAIEIAQNLPKDTPVDAQIPQQIDDWSQQLLIRATKLYEQEGNLSQAIDEVKQIPQDSNVSSRAIAAKDAWKSEYETNEAIITTAEKALTEEQWSYAKEQATRVQDSSPSIYWQKQAQAIISQAEAEIATTEPEITEPEITEPEVTEPEITEPETTQPEITEPEITEPEITEPEVTEPETTEPEVTEPETTEPEVTEPEVTEPEITEPEITEPEVTEPETTEPEVTEPETTEPEVTEPETTEPEITEPEVTEPETTTDNDSSSEELLQREEFEDEEESEPDLPSDSSPTDNPLFRDL